MRLSTCVRHLAASAGRLFVWSLALLWISQLPGVSAQTSPAGGAIRQILLGGPAPELDPSSLEMGALRDFYGRRQFEPAWDGNTEAQEQSKTALAALERADDDGLEPSDYHVGDALIRSRPVTPLEAAERDILLTDGLLRYARDLRSGRPALRTLDRDVELPTQRFDAGIALATALGSGRLPEFLAELGPLDPAYQRLKSALAHYRQIAATGGWKPVPDSVTGTIDEATPDGTLLRDRLAAELALPDPTGTDLTDAVKRFQAQHGLTADGRVGPATREALNVPASQRSLEIVANMERWHWLPRSLEAVRIVVNAPAGELDVLDQGQSVLSSRVIVGKPQAPTPILRAEALSVTINPPWNVPAKIARREIWPKLRRNPRYLQSENMILLNGPPGDPQGLGIDWRALTSFPYHVRQLPGPKNALGQIKLELPNRFDVYLHDTPAKAAFALDERYLSHGCVRVQQILPLASLALSGDANAMVAELQEAMASGETQHLPLKSPLPVYLLYWTAFVDNDGTVEFRPDVYGRDQRLIAAIEGRRNTTSYTENVGCPKA